MGDKQMSEAEVVSCLASGMTIGIGGWGSRRKPMSLVGELLRSDLRDLTVVAYGGADIGMLCAAGKVRKVIFGFVTLDSVPLDPHFRAARQTSAIEVAEYDEGMLQWGLYAASLRLPFLPTRAGLGTSIPDLNPDLATVNDPYGSGEALIAMPAIHLDAALVHMNRADRHGNAQYLGPDPYFDDLFCMAADQAFVSCERIVATEELTAGHHPSSIAIKRLWVNGVVEAPGGARFTSCLPDYPRDEETLAAYARSAASPESWRIFRDNFLSGRDDARAHREALAESGRYER